MPTGLLPKPLLQSIALLRPPIVREMVVEENVPARYQVIANAGCARLALQVSMHSANTDIKIRCVVVDTTWADSDWQLLEAYGAPYVLGTLSTRDQMEARRKLGDSRLHALTRKPSKREKLAPILKPNSKPLRKASSSKSVTEDGGA